MKPRQSVREKLQAVRELVSVRQSVLEFLDVSRIFESARNI
jgi:hypothetical protein